MSSIQASKFSLLLKTHQQKLKRLLKRAKKGGVVKATPESAQVSTLLGLKGGETPDFSSHKDQQVDLSEPEPSTVTLTPTRITLKYD